MLPTLRGRLNTPSFIDDIFGRDLENMFSERTGLNVPAVNLVEGDDEFRIEVAAPGLGKDDFKVDLDNNVLTISSEKEEKDEEKDKEDKVVRREFSYTKFSRSFALPDGADEENIKANHKDGVLYVQIPKKEEVKQKPPKQIDIK